MTAPESILRLVERFDANRRAYTDAKYNETQLRREFLDPFFKALGWDVDNAQGYAEAYKDVIHEATLTVEGSAKAPDYAFRIGGTRRFFVEAKKPSVDIEGGVGPAFQLRRYAWTAKLPLSILTDFEEFAVYDCRSKPDKSDKAYVARVMLFSYRDYVERWDEIAAVFSREAVLKGSFDRFAEETKGKKGTADVDDAILAEIEGWRAELARNLALRNPTLTAKDLNYAVQMTIDRILFLRIAEDRGIEPDGQLQSIAGGKDIYAGLVHLYQQADLRYNSGLFHFKDETGRGTHADSLTPTLALDDRVLKGILTNLYYPDCPYAWQLLPVEILGQVYEQFLGKVIRMTPAHQVKVEEKPEVRKAGGVYYTPAYIVDYIVKHTLGSLLEGKTPELAAALTVVDPACGSGSFLLGAYQYLLDWHLAWYLAHDPEKWAKGASPALVQGKDGWRLTLAKKRDILLANIHGVDIDPQAVEVTKLSLLLKVLEGVAVEEAQPSLRMERMLPDLGGNIQCGNSLIGPDYYDGRQMALLEADEVERVNAFDWQRAFPAVFARGGFDVVIGNPPYIRIQTLNSEDISYLSRKYRSAIGNYDIYCPFIEKGMTLIKEDGTSSFIVPHRFFKTEYGVGLREFLSRISAIEFIVDFDGYMVFSTASINTCILVMRKKSHNKFKYTRMLFTRKSDMEVQELVSRLHSEEGVSCDYITGDLPSSELTKEPWVFIFPNEKQLWNKLNQVQTRLIDVTSQIFQGLKTGGDEIFAVEFISREDKYYLVRCKYDNKEYMIEDQLLFPLVKGGELQRYALGDSHRFVLFPYQNGKLISKKYFEEEYPKAWMFLTSYKEYLSNRENGKMKGHSWYGFTRSQALTSMLQPKILTPEYYAHASFSIDMDGTRFFFGGGAGGYGIVPKDVSMNYLVGLLNSTLLDWYLQKISVRQYQTAFSYVKKYIGQLPILEVNKDSAADRERHDRMVGLVEQMLGLHARRAAAHTPHEVDLLTRQIDATDHAIDALVYELYGLTDAEIRIVEGG